MRTPCDETILSVALASVVDAPPMFARPSATDDGARVRRALVRRRVLENVRAGDDDDTTTVSDARSSSLVAMTERPAQLARDAGSARVADRAFNSSRQRRARLFVSSGPGGVVGTVSSRTGGVVAAASISTPSCNR